MRRGQGFFTTLLMIIPMTAVPVMAIFGIPQFVPAARPVVSEPATARRAPFIESRVGQSERPFDREFTLARDPQLTIFEAINIETSPAVDVDRNTSSPRTGWNSSPPDVSISPAGRIVPTSLHGASATQTDVVPANALHTGYRTALAAPLPVQPNPESALTGGSPDAGAERYQRIALGASPLAAKTPDVLRPTWRQAVDRLNEQGIRTFRLTPGSQPGTFQFSCLVSSVDDPRVSRWFDAEATEPLDAVARVLTKVEEWNRLQ